MQNKFYPPISDLLDASAIPGEFEFIENNAQAVIDTLLDKIFYKDLVVEVSTTGDEGFYNFILLSKSLRQSLFGTGMELVLFKGSEDIHSEFPIIFSWKWSVKEYISGFESNGFSYAPEAFVDILFMMAGIQDFEEFVGAILDVFLDDGNDTYLAFFNKIEATVDNYNDNSAGVEAEIQNIQTQLIIIKNEVFSLLNTTNLFTIKHIYQDYKNNPTLQPAVDSIQNSIEILWTTFNVDINVYADIVKAVIEDFGDIEDKFDKLLQLFQTWLGDITLNDLKDLLIPQFSVELNNINMALEFPRSFLLPMVEIADNFQIDPNPDHKAAIIFTAGKVGYSTQTGFDISINENNPIELPRCMIPNLGLQLEFLGVKLDLSRNHNIAEANTDDRPVEFIGAYIKEANIFLPEEWFSFDEDGSTLKLYASDLLIGTGGLSGTIGLDSVSGIDQQLQANMLLNDGRTISITAGADGILNEGDDVVLEGLAPEDGRFVLKEGGSLITENGKFKRFLSSDGELSYKLGKSSENGQWEIGFNQFYLKFWQNKIQESEIKGFLTIPNFKQEGKKENLKVDVSLFFENNGDFRVTASPEGGLTICLGEDGSIFKIRVNSLEAGKDDEKLYIEITGALDFSNNQLINKFLSKPIEVKKLRIYSDGSFEIEGGSIPIPGSVNINLGPVEVNITNITLGAEKLDNGDYKFIGFDCGLSTGSGGLDLRGDGIKLYFNHNGSDMFLRIAGIGIDLIIPGAASEETAALILKGYLSIKEEEYTGAVSFKLPKAKIAGGAAMKMRPKIPAFAVDAFLELSAPIPLGPTGLGIFGFRGMFGLNYIADLPAGATSNPDEMFNFYTKKVGNPLNGNNPEKGLHLGKIISAEEDSDSPISIGAGLSLGTSSDAGRAFSMQAFLFLALPEFFMISGKGNVLSERVSIVSENEPPFFAFMFITSEFISVGMGADYFIPDEPSEPENKGEFLDLNADSKMAFFFDDASAWYVHFGTKEEPNQAKVLKKIFQLDAYAYLMLSVSGIETGAGIKFEMKKKYGPVKVEASAYGDVNAMISFRKPQVGGGIACGGTIGAHVYGVGFDFVLDAYLMMTVPKPFIVKGGMEICMKVDLWLKTWRKCIDLNFKWEFDPNNDPAKIKIIDDVPFPVSAYHIGSKNTYELSYFNNALPNPANNTLETIPLDTFIDIQLKKPVNPIAVDTKINRLGLQHSNDFEFVPPREVEKQVKHQFIIEDINIKVWNQNNNSWQNYNPYEALDFNAYLENVDPSTLKLGSWQIKGRQHNNLRILADSPFSYADNMTGDFTPEQMGITATSLFCPAKEISDHCIRWDKSEKYLKGKWHSYQSITFNINSFDAEVVPFPNVYGIPLSLSFNNHSNLEIILPEKCLRASVKLFSFAKKVNVSFYDLQDNTITSNGVQTNVAEYVLIDEVVLGFIDFLAPVIYENEMQTINKIVIKPVKAEDTKKLELLNELDGLNSLQLEGIKKLDVQIKKIKSSLDSWEAQICGTKSKGISREIKVLITILENDLKTLKNRIIKLKSELDKNCKRKLELKDLLNKLRKEKLSHITDKEGSELNNIEIIEEFEQLTESLRIVKEKNEVLFEKELLKVEIKINKDFKVVDNRCDNLRLQYKGKLAELRKKEEQLERLKKLVNIKWDKRTNRCSTYLQEVCYLTQTEWWYNISIPSQAAVEESFDAFNNAVSKVIAPIWRPDETFAIEIKTDEIINNVSNQTDHYFAFKTAGPIGHFPLTHLPSGLKKQYGLKADGTLENNATSFAKKAEIPENALKFYLDYDKSYPNPIGNIINQKPLFYKNPILLLAYTDPLVYHFFNNWPNYNALGTRFSTMEIEIKDPAENLSPPADVPPLTLINPLPILSWNVDPNPLVVESLDVINRLRNPKIKNVDFNGQTCWQIGGDPIIPASKYTEIEIKHLKPSKLYTAIISSSYSKNEDNDRLSVPVHSYPFQTSRYANLEEQINSYYLKDIDLETGSVITKDAIFKIKYDLNQLGITLNQLRDVVSQSDVSAGFNLQLIHNFPDAFQRLLLGYLKQDPLHTALNTEINLLCDGDDILIGLWVRNPEPFNDPRIPDVNLQSTVSLIINGVNILSATPLFSKDKSEFVIFHNSLGQILNSLKLTFVYLVWKENSYVQDQSFTTENLIQS